MVNQHPMVTCTKHGFRRQSLFHALPLSPISRSFHVASPIQIGGLLWKMSILHFCRIVPRPSHANAVSDKWISKHKINANMSPER